MKAIILFILIGLFPLAGSLSAETIVNFDSRTDGRFVVFINGQKINHKPARSISLDYLPAGRNTVRVKNFCSGGFTELRQQVYLAPGFETSFVIRTNKYGELRLRKANEVALYQAPPVYHRPVRNPAPQRFRNMMADLNSMRFDNQKIHRVNRFITNNWLTTHQLEIMLRQFSFENNRIDIMIHAHGKLVDPQNFHLAYNELRFSSSVRTIEYELGLNNQPNFNRPGKRKGHYKKDGYHYAQRGQGKYKRNTDD